MIFRAAFLALLAACFSVAGALRAQATQELPIAVLMDRTDCERLLAHQRVAATGAQHTPAPDVAYRPGVDTAGRPVAPADLPGAQTGVVASSMVLELKFTLSDLLGSRAPARAGAAALTVGRLAIDPASGRLQLDGQAVEPPAEDQVLKACQAHLARPPQR